MRNQAEFIEAFLKTEEITFEKLTDGRFTCNFTGKNASYSVYVSFDDDLEYLVVYTNCGVNIPENMRGKAAEFLTRANYGMRIGCFEMDFNDGEVRFRTSINSKDSEITNEIMNRKFYTCIGVMDGYYTGLMKVVFGDADPEDTIDEIEDND